MYLKKLCCYLYRIFNGPLIQSELNQHRVLVYQIFKSFRKLLFHSEVFKFDSLSQTWWCAQVIGNKQANYESLLL